MPEIGVARAQNQPAPDAPPVISPYRQCGDTAQKRLRDIERRLGNAAHRRQTMYSVHFMMKTYGKELRLLRERAGYTLGEAAKQLQRFGVEVSNVGISRWENGYNNPTLDQFAALCNLYGVRDLEQVFMDHDFEGMETGLNQAGLGLLLQFRDILARNPRYRRPGATPDLEMLVMEERRAKPQREPDASEEVEISWDTTDDSEEQQHIVLEDDQLITEETGPKPRKRGRPRTRNVPRDIKCYTIGPAAGSGNMTDGGEWVMIPLPDIAPDNTDFTVRVSGESMQPVLQNNELIFVHNQNTVEVGEVGIFSLNGATLVKQLQSVNGEMWLVSANPEYKPIPVLDTDTFEVQGKVVGPRIHPSQIPLPEELRQHQAVTE